MSNGVADLLQEENLKVVGLEKIKELKTAILTDASQQANKLKQLRTLLCDRSILSIQKLRKTVIFTLGEVFKDILPTYRIRKLTELEKTQKQTAETRAVRESEEILLKSYEKYVDLLINIAAGRRPSRTAKEVIDYAWTHKDLTCAIRCAVELYTNNPSFNLSDKLLDIILPVLNSNESELSGFILNSLAAAFDGDKNGDDTLTVCKGICELVKQNNFEVENNVFILFLRLNIVEVDEETLDKQIKDDVDVKILNLKSSERKKLLSRKERKDDKSTLKYRKTLKEMSASTNLKRRLKINAFILRVVFDTYVSALKRSSECGTTTYLPLVLEGIARYSKLVNMDYIAGLIHLLYSVASQDATFISYKLHCVTTAMYIMLQCRRALTLNDPTHMYRLVYEWLLHCDQWDQPLSTKLYSPEMLKECCTLSHQLRGVIEFVHSCWEGIHIKPKKQEELWNQALSACHFEVKQFPHNLLNAHMLVCCLEGMLIHRRRHIPNQRIFAFTKRLATMTLHQPSLSLDVFLPFLLRVFHFFPQCEVLFDPDAEIGGVYDPEQTDPDLSKASSSSLWELLELKQSHSSAKVRLLADACIAWSQEDTNTKQMHVTTYRLSNVKLPQTEKTGLLVKRKPFVKHKKGFKKHRRN